MVILVIEDIFNMNAADQILAEVEKTLHEMRALALFAAGNDLDRSQRDKVQERIDELKKEIDGIVAMLEPPDAPLQ